MMFIIIGHEEDKEWKIYNQSLGTDTLKELRGCSTQL